MKLLFRADGNPSIGAGHVMRCLSIADAAMDKGIESIFVTAGDEFANTIRNRGVRHIVLGSAYRNMDDELPYLIQIIDDEQPVALIVDSYFVTDSYLGKIRQTMHAVGGRLIYIDDVLSFPYPCDTLINYNIYADEEAYVELYAGYSLPEMLLKTDYAPLRREFRVAAEKRLVRADRGRQILVSTGGADFEHLMIELVRAAKKVKKDHTFHFLIGAANEDRNLIVSEAAGESNLILHENVTNMSELMLSCDAAISAAGSTLYELCACRIPTVTYILADNQIPGARGFEHSDIMKCAGDIRETGAVKLSARLIDMALELCDNESERVLIAERQGSVVDGKGAERMIEHIWEEAETGFTDERS